MMKDYCYIRNLSNVTQLIISWIILPDKLFFIIMHCQYFRSRCVNTTSSSHQKYRRKIIYNQLRTNMIEIFRLSG